MESGDEFIVLGRVSGVYGVKGWLKIYSFTDPMESIVKYSPWFIRPGSYKGNPSAGWESVKLKAGRRHAKTVIAQMQDCNDRDAAQQYIGYEIAIRPDQLEVLNRADEFYWRDLIGLKVVNLEGVELGEVADFMETGANDVLVVTPAPTEMDGQTIDGQTDKAGILIPWTFGHTVVSVDLDASVIKVDWDKDWLV